jgi:TIR domain
MQRAAPEADRTIKVLSTDYLKSQFAFPEGAAAFAQDPQVLKRKLVPIMVRQCQPPGLLSSVVHIFLVGEEESGPRRLLLDGPQREAFRSSNCGATMSAFPRARRDLNS